MTEINKLTRLCNYLASLETITTHVQRWRECTRDKVPTDAWWAYLAHAEQTIGGIIAAHVAPEGQ